MKTSDDLNIQPPTGKRGSNKGAEVIGGIELVYNERVRQVRDLKYSAEHDARYTQGELALAGASYAQLVAGQSRHGWPDVRACASPRTWPWPGAAWKPSNSRLENAVRAAALMLAEVDRLLAAGERMPAEKDQGPETKDQGPEPSAE